MRLGKEAVLVLVVLAAILGCESVPPLSPENNIYQEVVEVTKPQGELFLSSMKWMTDAFTSAKAVIEYQDKEEGIIIGKGSAKVDVFGGGGRSTVEFTIRLEVKENKARITFKDMSIQKITDNDPLVAAIVNAGLVYGSEQHGRFTRWAKTVIRKYGTYLAGESDDW